MSRISSEQTIIETKPYVSQSDSAVTQRLASQQLPLDQAYDQEFLEVLNEFGTQDH